MNDPYEKGDTIDINVPRLGALSGVKVQRISEPKTSPLSTRKGQTVQRLHLAGGFAVDVAVQAA